MKRTRIKKKKIQKTKTRVFNSRKIATTSFRLTNVQARLLIKHCNISDKETRARIREILIQDPGLSLDLKNMYSSKGHTCIIRYSLIPNEIVTIHLDSSEGHQEAINMVNTFLHVKNFHWFVKDVSRNLSCSWNRIMRKHFNGNTSKKMFKGPFSFKKSNGMYAIELEGKYIGLVNLDTAKLIWKLPETFSSHSPYTTEELNKIAGRILSQEEFIKT